MVMVHDGNRISRGAPIRLCCGAAVWDDGGKILLMLRDDDQHWCLPGGGVDSGESVQEACEREVLEETDLQVKVGRLLAIYSNVDRVFEYPDGNRWQHIDLLFAREIAGGELRNTPEALDARFFAREELAHLRMHDVDRERMTDVFNPSAGVVFR